jgi:hypothetical protein
MDEKTLERERERKSERNFFVLLFFAKRVVSFHLRLRDICPFAKISRISLLSVFFLFFGLLPRRSSLTRERRKKKKRETLWAFVKVDFVFASSTTRGKRERERERNVSNTFGGLCFSSARDDDDDFDDDFDDETVLSVIFAWGGQKDFERFYRRECTASKAT